MVEFETLIPIEILFRICFHISGRDLFHSAQVNRRWNCVVHSTTEATLFRRFPKTYKRLNPRDRKDLRKVEEEAYQYLAQPVRDFFNATKDGNDGAINALIESKTIGFDDLFCVDQREMTSPFEIIISQNSQEVCKKVYEDLLAPRCNGTLELLLWAVRSHQTLNRVGELWEAERSEQQNRSVQLLLRALFARQSLDETRREEHRRAQHVENGRTPLLDACMYGHVEAVKFLVSHGESVNKTDQSGYTPLLEACRWGYLEIAAYLIENGAHTVVNKPNNFGDTPLSEAVRWENLEITLFLIKNGADVTRLEPKTQEKLLYLLRKNEGSTESSLVEKMLETYLNRRGVAGKFAARCLLKALRTEKKEDLDKVGDYHAVLSGLDLKLIYQLSKPFLDKIAKALEEPTSRRIIWMSRPTRS